MCLPCQDSRRSVGMEPELSGTKNSKSSVCMICFIAPQLIGATEKPHKHTRDHIVPRKTTPCHHRNMFPWWQLKFVIMTLHQQVRVNYCHPCSTPLPHTHIHELPSVVSSFYVSDSLCLKKTQIFQMLNLACFCGSSCSGIIKMTWDKSLTLDPFHSWLSSYSFKAIKSTVSYLMHDTGL